MKRTNIKISRYDDGEFWVDIIDSGENYEAWITHKNCSISNLLKIGG